jgi:hypothetical protein
MCVCMWCSLLRERERASETCCCCLTAVLRFNNIAKMLSRSQRSCWIASKNFPRCFATAVSRTFNLNNALDKAHEGKTLKEVILLPPSALQGLTPAGDEVLAKFKIHTIQDLASWKLYRIARAVVDMSVFEETGQRAEGTASNLDNAFDKDKWGMSLKELCDQPPHCVRGTAPWVDKELSEYKGLNTLRDIAKWKYPAIAHDICTLAEFEE